MNEKKILGGEFRIETDALASEIKQDISPGYSLGRSCLYAILDAIKPCVEEVLLPDYSCSSVAEVPLRIGLPFKHYHIEPTLLPDTDHLKGLIKSSNEKLAIILISYFGIVDLENVIKDIRSNYPEIIIIVDDVQNFYGFGKQSDFDYCFTSYRKWFAVPDGADILQKAGMPKVQLFDRQGDYVIYKAAGNILKNHVDMIGDSLSLELLEKGENQMDEEYRYGCSDIGRNLFQRIDLNSVAVKRKRNAKILHDGLERLGIRHFYNPERTPLFVPIVIQNRDEIRKALFAENIFAPIHWPVKDTDTQGNNELYNAELSLICDQRYDKEDMERMLSGIKKAV